MQTQKTVSILDTLQKNFDYDRISCELGNFTNIDSLEKLSQTVTRYEEDGYNHMTTFCIPNKTNTLFIPDRGHSAGDVWESGVGLMIFNHVFFFESQMDTGWSHDISSCCQGCHAKYIGLHKKCCDNTLQDLEVVCADMTPEFASAWLRRFCNLEKGFKSPLAFPHEIQQTLT